MEVATPAAEARAATVEPVEETSRTGWLWPPLGLIALGFLVWAVANWVNRGPRSGATALLRRLRKARAWRARLPASKSPLEITDFRLVDHPAGKVLAWRTSRPATSQVVLGKTDELELGPAPAEVSRHDLVTLHQVGVAASTPGTYYVRAPLRGRRRPVVLSPPHTFTLH